MHSSTKCVAMTHDQAQHGSCKKVSDECKNSSSSCGANFGQTLVDHGCCHKASPLCQAGTVLIDGSKVCTEYEVRYAGAYCADSTQRCYSRAELAPHFGGCCTVPATKFACDDLTTDAAKAVCTAAQSLGLDTVPLADGVKDLDRTLEVEVKSPKGMIFDATKECAPNICDAYELPPVTSFRFGTSAAETDTAQTRGDSTGPAVQFDCDASTDMYTLVFWDALGMLGGPSTVSSKGFLHGAWTNIKCSANKKADFSTAAVLMPYSAPSNPSAQFSSNYGFYLFKQKSEVELGKYGKLAGFDPTAFFRKALSIFSSEKQESGRFIIIVCLRRRALCKTECPNKL